MGPREAAVVVVVAFLTVPAAWTLLAAGFMAYLGNVVDGQASPGDVRRVWLSLAFLLALAFGGTSLARRARRVDRATHPKETQEPPKTD